MKKNNLTTKEIYKIYHSLNNIFIDTWFLDSATRESKTLIKIYNENKLIFGGKRLFEERKKKKKYQKKNFN